MARPNCSCIIPFHNEGERILDVLAPVTQVQGVSQIVCVDDGSSDGGAALVCDRFPQVVLVSLPENQGKAEAIRQGLARVAQPYTLLLDADLRFLNAHELDLAISLMVSKPRIDMIILRRVNAAVNAKITRGDVLYSGERILKTDDLRCVLESRPRGYQIEIAINQYMRDRHKQVYWMPSSAQNTYKSVKRGLVPGLKEDLDMFEEMLAYEGAGAYVQQLLTFARNEAPGSTRTNGVKLWKNRTG